MERQVAWGKGFDKTEIYLLYEGGHPSFLKRDEGVVLGVGENAVTVERYVLMKPRGIRELWKEHGIFGYKNPLSFKEAWKENVTGKFKREPMFQIPYDKIVKCEISADSALETTTVTRSPREDMVGGVKGSVTTSMDTIMVIEAKAHKGDKEVTIPITFTRIFGHIGGRGLTTSTREKLNDIIIQIHIKMNEVNPVTLDF
jgi:hypothetical protein